MTAFIEGFADSKVQSLQALLSPCAGACIRARLLRRILVSCPILPSLNGAQGSLACNIHLALPNYSGLATLLFSGLRSVALGANPELSATVNSSPSVQDASPVCSTHMRALNFNPSP